MPMRYLVIALCAAVAAFLLPNTDGLAKARPGDDQARAARTAAPDAANTEAGIKLAQRMGGRRSFGGRRAAKAGRAFRGGGRHGLRAGRAFAPPRAFGPRIGGRRIIGPRFGGRRAFVRPYVGRRYIGRRYYTPIVPFVYGGLAAPYFYYEYYDDYPAGRCAYWHRRCVRNWGYRTSNYYGCMRYHGCSRY